MSPDGYDPFATDILEAEAYERGFEEGKQQAADDEYDKGYDAGYEDGRLEADSSGEYEYERGLDNGYTDGYDDGVADTKSEYGDFLSTFREIENDMYWSLQDGTANDHNALIARVKHWHDRIRTELEDAPL